MFPSLIPVLLRRRASRALTATALSSITAVSGSTAVFSSLAESGGITVASALAASTAAATAVLTPQAASAQSMFTAAELDPQRFVLVASPVGSSGRYQLNVYEQLNNMKPCFAVGTGKPAAVNPLLATFDFTGICSRYIDANGYSVRVGPSDLAGAYRLLVRSEAGDTLLIALPTKPGAGPEMVVARAGGAASGFHKLDFEPGWRLMRRQFGGRNLGHVYLFSEAWPAEGTPVTGTGTGTGQVPPAPVPAAAARPDPKATPRSFTAPGTPASAPLRATPAKPGPQPATFPTN